MQNRPKFMIDFWVWLYMSNILDVICKKHEGGVKSEILCVGQIARAEKKGRKIAFLPDASFMGQISTKYFFKLYHKKIFAVSFKSYIQLVPKISFTSFLQPAWIETDSIVKCSSAVGCVQLVPNIYQKWNWTEDNLQICCLK